jgi:glycosyltransferase involved in cell wall biosynthesis
MKIYIARLELGRTGGGWSFQDNFYNGLKEHITANIDEADVYFISSPSMVQRDEVQEAKAKGLKIVLRLDNAVRNSRNRNTGMTRMKDFAEWADLVVYQSAWAKDYLIPFTGVDGEVILNGTDTGVFHPGSNTPDPNMVLYSRFNRDETKNFEVARYWFSRFAQDQGGDAHLSIVGQFSDELRKGNFDFYNGESFRYFGVLGKQEMADLYRNCGKFLYTYYNDACSNTLIEALCSGCEIVGDKYYRRSGGASEIMAAFEGAGDLQKARRFFSIERMAMEYKEAIERIL